MLEIDQMEPTFHLELHGCGVIHNLGFFLLFLFCCYFGNIQKKILGAKCHSLMLVFELLCSSSRVCQNL